MSRRDLKFLAILMLIGFCLSGSPALIGQDQFIERHSFSREWSLVEAIPASEAVQAAVAEGEFVYAISSIEVAKYERATGRRIDFSTGEARHLNSGFFWQGNLYCAHSNYPQKPEQSEIKVLDPVSMELSTFKEFGNFGGSLTWAVHHDGHWWCNFAHYGADNGKTFLVRFDDNWKESGRWTYPEELISQLGAYSLSGGIWRDGHLLVTGHDDPVLYRLRVPESGSVLELIGSQYVPFTGQGIAMDPRTGGLIGISRSERQIRLAVEQSDSYRLRVLTYNIHHAEGTDGKLDVARIAAVIRSVAPDLVALQEVDQNTLRTLQVDQAKELARLTKMQFVFGANIDLQGGTYGNAVLSRFPIRSSKNHLLPRFDDGEQRGVLEVEVDLPSGHGPLRLLATHLDHRRNDRERVASAGWINEFFAKNGEAPALLAGDLNDLPGSTTLTILGGEWTSTTPAPLSTSPAGNPISQIDYVLCRPTARWSVREARVLDEPVASDHRPLLTVLELSPHGKRGNP